MATSRLDDPTPPAPIPRTFADYVKSFGPGFVVILTWLGSGDILTAGISGGNYGYALMWAMVFALLMRFFFVSTIAKYQLCNPHGEGVLDGLVRLHPWYAPFLLAVAVIVAHVNGTYMLAGIGEIMVELTGAGREWQWALFWVAVGLVIIFRPVYARVEWMFKGFMVLMTVSLLGTALWVGPNLAGIFKGILTFELPARQGPFGAMVVAMAMVGAVGGSLMNLVYPYFLEQKGWRGPAYRRVQTYDFMLAIGAMILFNLAVWTLGAELVHASGRQIGTLDDLTELLGIVLGNGGRLLFFLGLFAAVYTSLLGCGLGLGCLASHAYQRWRGPGRRPLRPSPPSRLPPGGGLDPGLAAGLDLHRSSRLRPADAAGQYPDGGAHSSPGRRPLVDHGQPAPDRPALLQPLVGEPSHGISVYSGPVGYGRVGQVGSGDVGLD